MDNLDNLAEDNPRFRERLLREHKRVVQEDGFIEKGKASHGKPLKFVCDICNYKFRYPSHLKRHLRAHVGVKPYKCDLCGYSSTRNDGIHSHFTRIHPDHECCPCASCKAENLSTESEQLHDNVDDRTVAEELTEGSVYETSTDTHGTYLEHSTTDSRGHTDGTFATEVQRLTESERKEATKSFQSCRTGLRVKKQTKNDNVGSEESLFVKAEFEKCRYCEFRTKDALTLLNHLRYHTGQRITKQRVTHLRKRSVCRGSR